MTMDMTNEAALAALGDQELDDSSVRKRLPAPIASLYSYLRTELRRPESLRLAIDVAKALGSRPRDLSLVWPRFAIWLLVDPADGVARFASGDAMAAVQRVAALYERTLASEVVTATEWRDAETAVRVAAWKAAETETAAERTAAWRTAALATRNMAAAAAAASGKVAGTEAEAATAMHRQASKLLALIQEAPWT